MEDIVDFLISNSDNKELLVETRKKIGMNRKEFAEYFKIPYRTVQDWELGKRQMPEYVLRLILYRIYDHSLSSTSAKEPNRLHL